MITSSNFFNKSLYSIDSQKEHEEQEMGPWYMSKQRNYSTLDNKKKQNNSKTIHRRYQYQKRNIALRQRQSYLLTHSLDVKLDSNIQNIERRTKFGSKLVVQNFLPKLPKNLATIAQKRQHGFIRQNQSPLAYQLNFITKKSKDGSKRRNSLSFSQNIQKKINLEKYIHKQESSKFNIYEKCVIESKRKSLQSLNKRNLNKADKYNFSIL